MDSIERSIRSRLSKYAERHEPPEHAGEQLLAMAAAKPVNAAPCETGWDWSVQDTVTTCALLTLTRSYALGWFGVFG